MNQESQVTPVTPLSNAVRHHAASGAKQVRGSDHPVFGALTLGAFDQLMAFLAHPDPAAWRQLAETTVLSAGAVGAVIQVDNLAEAVQASATGAGLEPSGYQTGIALMTWSSQGGQTAATALEREGDPIPTAVLAYDTSIETERNRWSDWLHLGNLIQYLGEHAVITTTSAYDPGP